MSEKMRRVKSFLFFGLCLTLTLFSCTGINDIQKYVAESRCAHQSISSRADSEVPQAIRTADLDSSLVASFSFESLNMAHAIGLTEGLEEYIKLKKSYGQSPSVESRMELLVLSQRISEGINLASLEISSVASELDCEEERIAQAADYMKRLEDRTESKLTVAAIVVSASSAIVSGFVLASGRSGSNLEYYAIAAGIAEASLGISILVNSRSIKFSHQRNALREIWENKSSGIFPPFVWYYLNYTDPTNPDATSMRERIVERWISFRQIEGVNSRKKQKLLNLYFGDGGKYETEQLYNRASMYDQLESHIKLIKQDLTLLSIEFERMK